MDLADLLHADGADNMGGTLAKIFVAKVSDIVTHPAIIGSPATLSDYATAAGTFTMVAGKYFHEVYVTMDKNGLDDKLVGETDGKSFESVAEFVHPGNKAAVLGFAAYAKNTNLVLVIPDANGQQRIVGNAALPAKVDQIDISTGKATADFRNCKFVVKTKGNSPAPVFAGTVPVAP